MLKNHALAAMLPTPSQANGTGIATAPDKIT
jgi:hypothetical protein